MHEREEAVLDHLKRTSSSWDAWILIEALRKEPEEIVDIQDEAESEKEREGHHTLQKGDDKSGNDLLISAAGATLSKSTESIQKENEPKR